MFDHILNFTPHAITFVSDGGNVTIPSSGLARVKADTIDAGTTICGVPVTHTVLGDVTGLPEPSDGVAIIVSRLVADAVPEREDVFIVNESVRDEKGRIIGCRSIAHV